MFQSLFEIVPYYAAWIFAVLLLVNRSYGRPVLAITVIAIGVFEFYAKIWYGDEKYEQLIAYFLVFIPDTYTIGEALLVLRRLMPIILQFALLAMDNSFDVPSLKVEESLEILKKIVAT